MRIVDIMSRVVIAVPPTTSWQDAVATMREHQIHHLPVVEDGVLLGTLRESDIQRAAVMQSKQGDAPVAVERVMNRHFHTVAPLALLTDAVNLMLKHRISIVPVVENERMVGLVTHTDVMSLFTTWFGGDRDALYVRIQRDDRSFGKLTGAMHFFAREIQTVTFLTGGDMLLIFRLFQGASEGHRLLERLQTDWEFNIVDACINLEGQRHFQHLAKSTNGV